MKKLNWKPLNAQAWAEIAKKGFFYADAMVRMKDGTEKRALISVEDESFGADPYESRGYGAYHFLDGNNVIDDEVVEFSFLYSENGNILAQ